MSEIGGDLADVLESTSNTPFDYDSTDSDPDDGADNWVKSAAKDKVTQDVYAGGKIQQLHYSPDSWATNGELFWRAPKVTKSLPAGVYRASSSSDLGAHLVAVKLEVDNLILMDDGPTMDVLNEIIQFMACEHEFTKRGILFKRGILLYGPPGGGKTSTVHQLNQLIIKNHDGIVVLSSHPGITAECLRMVRQREPNRQILCVMEDLDSLIRTFGEDGFLSLLDGESQVNNVIFVATTNYPERLDKRIANRASRFDLVKRIGLPSEKARKLFLTTTEPSLTEAELNEFLKKSDKFTMAELKELIVLTRCLGYSLDPAIKRLQELSKKEKTSDDDREIKAGFDLSSMVRKEGSSAIQK